MNRIRKKKLLHIESAFDRRAAILQKIARVLLGIACFGFSIGIVVSSFVGVVFYGNMWLLPLLILLPLWYLMYLSCVFELVGIFYSMSLGLLIFWYFYHVWSLSGHSNSLLAYSIISLTIGTSISAIFLSAWIIERKSVPYKKLVQ